MTSITRDFKTAVRLNAGQPVEFHGPILRLPVGDILSSLAVWVDGRIPGRFQAKFRVTAIVETGPTDEGHPTPAYEVYQVTILPDSPAQPAPGVSREGTLRLDTTSKDWTSILTLSAS